MTDQSRSKFTQSHPSDKELDQAMESSLSSLDAGSQSVPLKRQWDEELEAQLEAALQGFDASAAFAAPKKARPISDEPRPPSRGEARGQDRPQPEVQKAKVLSIRGEDVFLDLGAKSEGLIPLSQFGDNPPEVGSTIEVILDRLDESEGLMLMKLKGAAVHATWQTLERGLIVEARVVKEVKGGLQVDVDGMRGFLPISQIELGRVEETKPYLNQRFRVSVTESNPREKNLIVSRKDILMREREEQKEKTWAELEVDQVRKGTVRSVRDFGAFVDLGGVDGLLHIADMSWTRTSKSDDLVRVGDEVEVKVLRIDRENRKVSLGLKQLAPSPWHDVENRFTKGETVPGKVTRLMEFGAFVELEPGIEGLIHVSEMSSKRVFRVSDHVQPDQEVEVRILSIDPENKRISLSLRSLAPPAAPEDQSQDADAQEESPPPPKPERKTPLKGGLGDHDPRPFG